MHRASCRGQDRSEFDHEASAREATETQLARTAAEVRFKKVERLDATAAQLQGAISNEYEIVSKGIQYMEQPGVSKTNKQAAAQKLETTCNKLEELLDKQLEVAQTRVETLAPEMERLAALDYKLTKHNVTAQDRTDAQVLRPKVKSALEQLATAQKQREDFMVDVEWVRLGGPESPPA